MFQIEATGWKAPGRMLPRKKKKKKRKNECLPGRLEILVRNFEEISGGPTNTFTY